METKLRDFKEFIVLVEPHFALYRYCEIIQRRYKTLVLTIDPDACLASEEHYNHQWHIADSHIDELVKYDSVDVDSMLRALEPYRGRIAGVLPGDDSFVPIAAHLGRALGFDCALPEDAECQHLKTAMKQRLAERQVNTAEFAVVRDFEQAAAAWESFDRDCMIKMVDMHASMNVFRVTSRRQLQNAWETIVLNKRKLEVPFELSRDVLMEKFVGGRELTAEGYVQDNHIEILNFCEKVVGSNFIVIGHYIPAQVSETEANQLREITEQCVQAIGMRNCPFHIEVHLENGVPYVIECASRPPGQHIVQLIEQCCGIDLMEIAIDLAVGSKVEISARPPRSHFAMLVIHAHESGVLQSVEGLDELRARGGVIHVNLDVKPGDRVRKLDTFHQRYGFVILADSTADGVREKAKWMRENVRMVV